MVKKYRTVVDLLERSARLFPKKIALIYEDKKYSYEYLSKESSRISGNLNSKVRKSQVVGLLVSNSPEFIINYFAILKSGSIALLLGSNISDDNFKFQIKNTSAKILITEGKYIAKTKRVRLFNKITILDAFDKSEPDRPFKKCAMNGDDTSTIIFTSGATAEPKGAKLKHRNVVSATMNIVEYLKLNHNDIDVNISPLSHSFGLGHIHCIFAVGGTVILFRDAINIRAVMEAIIKYKATTFAAVPAILKLMLKYYRNHLEDCDKFLRMVQTNTSHLEHGLIKGMLKVLPTTQFCYYYGLTEASRSTFITFNDLPKKIDSVGKPIGDIRIKIVDERDHPVPSLNVGEVCIKGKNVINEYWDNPKASSSIKHGWLYTQDLGYVDNDGYLYFKGRKNDTINVSGEKVFPEEVESVIRQIPEVADVAVIGMYDRLLGQAVRAYIQPKVKNFDKKIIIDHCRKKLESYKIPRSIKIINVIPRTENGKLRREFLRQYY